MIKILIIEDDQDVVRQVKNALSGNFDCTVDVAYNGKEGLDKMGDKMYGLVITAIMIPKLNGMEVCQFMLKDEKLKNIPVLLLSVLPVESNIFQKSLTKFNELSMVKDALEKPFSDEKLLKKVEKVIK